jgi:hypothetical protein
VSGRPSFLELLRQLKAERPWTDPIWSVNAKLDSRLHVQRHCRLCRLPRLYEVRHELAGIREPGYADRVVVKPNQGAVARGVLPLALVPRAEGYLGANEWFAGTGEGTVPWDVWVEWLTWKAHAAQHNPRTPGHPDNVAGPWLVEEWIHPAPSQEVPLAWRGYMRWRQAEEAPILPDDWKAYVIHGRVQFWAQFRRDPGAPRDSGRVAVCYWTREHERIPYGIKRDRRPADLPAAQHPEALTAAAEELASTLPAPFVRLDFYDDASGPVFSEITPEPGGSNRFLAEWDERMGRAWLDGLEGVA